MVILKRALGQIHLALAGLTIALAALTACGGGGGNARPSATPTPSATPSGTPTPFPIALGLGAGTGVAVGFGGDRYLVTFADSTNRSAQNVFGLRLTKDGDTIDAQPFLLSDFGDDPFLDAVALYAPGGIASDGSSFGVFLFGTGTVQQGPPGQVVGFVSVPAEGPPALPATAVDEQASFSMAQAALVSPIAATSNGTSFLGVYQRVLSLVGSFSVSQVLGQIVTVTELGVQSQGAGPFSGIVPPVDGMLTSGSAPGVAIGATFTLVAWVETSVDQDSPAAVATHVQGVLLTPEAATFVGLGDTEVGSQNVAVASDGESFLVVWTATTPTEPAVLSELRAVRFTPGGTAEPPGGFLIDGGGGAKLLGGIGFADGVYLVVWIDEGVVRGARLGDSGSVADVFTIDAGPAASVALATDGARFLAVLDRLDGTASSDVLGTFIPAR